MNCKHTNTKIIATFPETIIDEAFRVRVRRCKDCGERIKTIEITDKEYRLMRVMKDGLQAQKNIGVL